MRVKRNDRLRIVKMVPGDTERVAASPTAQRVHELVAQVLEFCPGSEGIKKYVAGSVDAFVRFQLPTEFTLSPLQDPELFDGAKIEQYEMRLWFAARVNVRDTPAGLALAAELREWMESFEKRYRG